MNQPPLRLQFLEPSSAGVSVVSVRSRLVLQDQHNVELGNWGRPPWEEAACGLGTQGPKYSRTITTRVRAPGSQEVDFFVPEFCRVPALPAIVSLVSVSRRVVGFKNQVCCIPPPQ